MRINLALKIVREWAAIALKADIAAHREAVDAQEGWKRHPAVHPDCDVCTAHKAVKAAVERVS